MASVALSNKTIGSIVKLKVNGTLRDFIVVHQGKPSAIYDASCDGTWLLMKDCYEARQWHSSNVNDYASSTIHSYLNSTFLNLIDEYLPYLTIRYRQLISLPILAAPLRQIAGGKKDAPEVIDGGIEFPIGQLLVDLLRNRPSVNQPFQLFPGSRL